MGTAWHWHVAREPLTLTHCSSIAEASIYCTSRQPAVHVRHRRCILGAVPDRPRRFLHRPEIDSRQQHQHESITRYWQNTAINGSVISSQYYGTTVDNKNEEAQAPKANCPPLAQNKQRHHNKRRSLLPNGKPSRCRSTAGPEYLSRNGQQPVLGAASSPKPEPIPSGMSPQIHSQLRHMFDSASLVLLATHLVPMSALFLSFNLQRRVADEGVVGIYLGPAISLYNACYCILVCIPITYLYGSNILYVGASNQLCRASWVAFLR